MRVEYTKSAVRAIQRMDKALRNRSRHIAHANKTNLLHAYPFPRGRCPLDPRQRN